MDSVLFKLPVGFKLWMDKITISCELIPQVHGKEEAWGRILHDYRFLSLTQLEHFLYKQQELVLHPNKDLERKVSPSLKDAVSYDKLIYALL